MLSAAAAAASRVGVVASETCSYKGPATDSEACGSAIARSAVSYAKKLTIGVSEPVILRTHGETNSHRSPVRPRETVKSMNSEGTARSLPASVVNRLCGRIDSNSPLLPPSHPLVALPLTPSSPLGENKAHRWRSRRVLRVGVRNYRDNTGLWGPIRPVLSLDCQTPCKHWWKDFRCLGVVSVRVQSLRFCPSSVLCVTNQGWLKMVVTGLKTHLESQVLPLDLQTIPSHLNWTIQIHKHELIYINMLLNDFQPAWKW